MKLTPAITIVLGALGLLGCDSWPLHAALPDPVDPVTPTVDRRAITEDTTRPAGSTQDLGEVRAPAELTISGSVDGCGWDAGAPWPQWPDHPVDDDGDGVVDRTGPRHAGWYAGDADLFAIATPTGGALRAELRWDRAPDGMNSVFQPGTPGAWTNESDLDVVLFSGADAGPDQVLAEGGFSRSHPELTGAPVLVTGEQGSVFSVGCHHGLGSEYSLLVVLAGG